MAVQVPPILVLIVCKTVIAGPTDQNAAFTGYENREWATEHSMMVCRRNEVQLFDPAEGAKLNSNDDPAPALNANFFNATQCARAGIRLAIDWDRAHRNTRWRVWRVGCPTPIVDLRTGTVIGYKLPECGHRDTVICETDSVI
ncbi:MAG TPA: hypothetical protein VNJ31_07705 [Methyloceanibacter sp.]|nr:hypothetical protein [Methyloceanibacter sp.]